MAEEKKTRNELKSWHLLLVGLGFLVIGILVGTVVGDLMVVLGAPIFLLIALTTFIRERIRASKS